MISPGLRISLLLLCLTVTPGCRQEPLNIDSAERAFAGDYYQGDGLGYNLHLSLREDGTFDCDWTGCLGDYGDSSGTWTKVGDVLVMKPEVASGMFEDSPVENIQLLQEGSKLRMIYMSDLEFADDPGMYEFLSFSKIPLD